MEEVRELIREKMEGVASLLVPLKVDMAAGQSWYEAK
jgi:DNA polymerase-1